MMDNATREAMRALADELEQHVESVCSEMNVDIYRPWSDRPDTYAAFIHFFDQGVWWYRGTVWDHAKLSYALQGRGDDFAVIEELLNKAHGKCRVEAPRDQVIDATKAAIRAYFAPIIAMIREHAGGLTAVEVHPMPADLHPNLRPVAGWPEIVEPTKPMTRAELARCVGMNDHEVCGAIQSGTIKARPIKARSWVAEMESVIQFGAVKIQDIQPQLRTTPANHS